MSNTALPPNWVFGTISQLVGPAGLFTDGDWVESKDQEPDGEVSLVQLSDIGDGNFTRRSRRAMTVDRAQELGCTFLQRGDVLVARMPSPLGRSCIYPGTPEPAVTVVDICIVRADQANYDNRWLMHFINAPGFREQILSKQSGSTRKRISRGNLATLRLPIPPREEQTAIADRLDVLLTELSKAASELREASTKLQPLRQSILQSAVTGELTIDWRTNNRPGEDAAEDLLRQALYRRQELWRSEQSTNQKGKGKPSEKNWKKRYEQPDPPLGDLATLPDGWIWATVEQLGEVRLGRQRTPEKARGPGQTKYIRAANIAEDGINLTDVLKMAFSAAEKQLFQLQPGDILLTEASGSPEHVGRPAIWRGADELYCFQNTVIRFRPYGVSSAYLYRVFQAWQKLGRFEALSKGVGINHLSASKFAKVPIPVPSPAEQAEIVRRLDLAMTDLDTKGKAIATLLEDCEIERQNILDQAYHGKLVEQDASHESAVELLERIGSAAAAPARPKASPSRQKFKLPRSRARMKAIDVLSKEKQWISAQTLFERCGIADGSATEVLEEIYAELKALDQAKRLAVRRIGDVDELRLLGN